MMQSWEFVTRWTSVSNQLSIGGASRPIFHPPPTGSSLSLSVNKYPSLNFSQTKPDGIQRGKRQLYDLSIVRKQFEALQ